MIREKREILVSAFSAISVGIIIYQLVYNPTNPIEDIIQINNSIIYHINYIY